MEDSVCTGLGGIGRREEGENGEKDILLETCMNRVKRGREAETM